MVQVNEQVNEMVKKYIDYNGSIIMRVVSGIQDIGSVAGNVFVQEQAKTVCMNIVTHIDRIDDTNIQFLEG